MQMLMFTEYVLVCFFTYDVLIALMLLPSFSCVCPTRFNANQCCTYVVCCLSLLGVSKPLSFATGVSKEALLPSPVRLVVVRLSFPSPSQSTLTQM